MTRMTGGQALARSMLREGVRTVFGIPGAGQYEAVDALWETPEIRYVSVRHEQAATYMADGYARGRRGHSRGHRRSRTRCLQRTRRHGHRRRPLFPHARHHRRRQFPRRVGGRGRVVRAVGPVDGPGRAARRCPRRRSGGDETDEERGAPARCCFRGRGRLWQPRRMSICRSRRSTGRILPSRSWFDARRNSSGTRSPR